jgi:hypothetical protein
VAGESALEQARRQREKAARLIESADRWERGASGEAAVAAAMADLEASGWTLLHDLAWPGRKYANIDHVAIGNGLVFVIDAKNWTGDVAASGGVLRQNGRSRAKEVAAIAEAAQAVASVVPGLPVDAVRPVLCLVRDDWLSARFGEVLVCSSHNLVAQLRGQPVATHGLSPQHISELVGSLQTHGANAERARPRTRPRASKGRTRRESSASVAIKMAAALAIAALALSQPAWLTSSARRVSDEFVSLIAPSTSDPAPADKTPARDARPRKQRKAKDKQ